MKGNIYLVLFGIALVTLAQLLTYYTNPLNWQTFESLPEHPRILAFNIIIFATAIAMFILLMRLIRKENKEQKEKIEKENKERNRNLIEAFKKALTKALKEDREERQKDKI